MTEEQQTEDLRQPPPRRRREEPTIRGDMDSVDWRIAPGIEVDLRVRNFLPTEELLGERLGGLDSPRAYQPALTATLRFKFDPD